MSNYQMETSTKIRPLSNGNDPEDNPRFNYHDWIPEVRILARSLLPSHQYPNGLLDRGLVYTDAQWAEFHPGMDRPLPPVPLDKPAAKAAIGVRKKYDMRKKEVQEYNQAIAFLLKVVTDSLGDADKAALDRLDQQITTIDIVTYAFREYGEITSADFDYLRHTILEHKIATARELNAHVTDLTWTFRMFERANQGESTFNKTRYFLDSLTNIPLLHGYASEYIIQHSLATRSFEAMADDVKKSARNASAFDLSFTVSQVVPSVGTTTTNKRRTRSGACCPDKKKARPDHGGGGTPISNGGELCPYHPYGTHLAKDCRTFKKLQDMVDRNRI